MNEWMNARDQVYEPLKIVWITFEMDNFVLFCFLKKKNCQLKLLNAFILIMYIKTIVGTKYSNEMNWIESEGFKNMLDWSWVKIHTRNYTQIKKKVLILTKTKNGHSRKISYY